MASKINTSISINDVKDNLIDNGIDLDADITTLTNPDWIDHRSGGEISQVIYVHQVPEFVAFHAMNPDLWGHTVGLFGPTAIGKTEAVRQGLELAAERMGRKLWMTELHVSQMGPVDALGVPRERDGRTYWAPMEMWPLAEVLEKRYGHETQVQQFLANYRKTGKVNFEMLPEDWYVHFHDEVTNPSSPQVPHQLFPSWLGDGQGRKIGGHRLVSDFQVVLAGNRVEDGTNSINLAASAVTRMGVIEVVPHYGGWLQHYAFKPRMINGEEATKIHPIVIAYLNKFNRSFAPQEQNERSPMEPFPTPRNWKYVSDIFYAHESYPLKDELLKSAIVGRVGASTAQELFTFITHYKDLPDVDKLMKGADISNFPKKNRPDLLCILGTQMVMKLNESNAKVFMKYMNDEEKFPPEISAMTMRQLRPANKLTDLVRNWAPQEFSKWTEQKRAFVF